MKIQTPPNSSLTVRRVFKLRRGLKNPRIVAMAECACACGGYKLARLDDVLRGKTVSCGCRSHPRGKAHGQYKGGRIEGRGSKGYIQILKPEHPNSDSRGYVYEHRFVMAEHLGRPLKPEEVVHHADGDPTNNMIENLELMESQSTHKKHEFEEAAGVDDF